MRISHRLQLEELDTRHDAEPEWWEGCLIRIADGESIDDIAIEYGYFQSVVRHWMRADKDRESAYQDAIDTRKEMWTERLVTKAAQGALATIQDAQTGDGGALDIAQWPKGLLAACDSAEFGPDGQIYKVKMDSGKAADRLARYVGLEKAGDVNLSVYSLVGVLSEMPRAEARELPGAPKQIEVEDAVIVPAQAVAEEWRI